MKRVMVIDDEPMIRFLLKEALTEWGYEFIEAKKAIEGIQIIKKEKIDLIFLDIQMPQMNGLEAVQKIREIDRNVPVFMITAFHNMKDVVEMLEIGRHEFIGKPFDIDEVRVKIREYIG